MSSKDSDANTPAAAAPRRGFRAGIVGGGPVGLGLAHMLDRAGIEYVLLERRPTVLEESGFGLAFYPHGVRLLDQLGMLDEARRLYLPMRDKTTFAPDGRERCYNRLYESIEECHGHPWMLLKRQDVLRMLYERLPDRDSKVLTGKKVVAIDSRDDGVAVRCSDGSVIEGSFIAACDGVHSPIRGMMGELDDPKGNTTKRKTKKKKPVMTASYQLLVGHLDPIPDMPRNHLHEVHGKAGFSMQIFMFDTEGWFLAYRRLDPTPPADTYVGYTDADAEAFARDIMDRPVGEGRTFADLWKPRRWVRLVATEEGAVRGPWHRGRVVLVGDSACKMTPNAGLSANQGWQGAVALTNGLRGLLLSRRCSKGNKEEEGGSGEPDTAALEAVFRRYRAATLDMAKGSARTSALYIRTTSWHSPLYRVVDWLVPKLGGDERSFKIFTAPVVRQGLLLDWLPEPGYKAGTVEWVNKARVQ